MTWIAYWPWALTILSAALAVSAKDRARKVLLAAGVVLFSRYIVWRTVATINPARPMDAVLGIVLLIAEGYVLLNWVLTAFQLWRPSERRTPRVPDGSIAWPTVDVCITRYDEPVAVLRRTAVACMAMDYPGHKVVWFLDDGHSDEAREIADELGCRYLTRANNLGAKAGNLNAAMEHLSGDVLAVFDVDHVPSRGFLRETVPYLLADPRTAIVQTPHHFYNPDPFQRNLGGQGLVSNEQDFFYQVVLPGRDHWNAAFFCGSSGLIRRAALDDIGGFRTGTITEDLHTSLAIHARGWRSVVHGRVLAAGLAPESLRDFVGQRCRWAKGTFQMFRRENPLTVGGLSIPQRLCYLASGWYFLFPFARLTFLAAPIAYLLFGVRPVDASLVEILNYYGPCALVMLITFPILSRGYRGVFESDVAETASMFALMPAVLTGMFGTKVGQFGVTPKDRRSEVAYWDSIGRPHVVMLSLSAIALLWGVFSKDVGSGPAALSLVWATYNASVLAVVALTALQPPQVRIAFRFSRGFPVSVTPITGSDATWHGETLDISETGLAVSGSELPMGMALKVVVGGPSQALARAARVVRHSDCPDGTTMTALEFADCRLGQQDDVIRLITDDYDCWQRGAGPARSSGPNLLFRVIRMLGGFGYSSAIRPRTPQ